MSDWDPAELDVLARVRALGVEHEVLECPPEHADTAVFCERYGTPLETAANTLVVATRRPPRRYAACVVSGTSRIANAALRRLLESSRVSFASGEEMRELTGMTVGGVTIFGLPPEVPIYVDPALMAQPYIVLGSGGRHGKIKVSPRIFDHFPNARVVDDLARPAAAPDDPTAA